MQNYSEWLASNLDSITWKVWDQNDSFIVPAVSGPFTGPMIAACKQTAPRIVACLNACKGQPTSSLSAAPADASQ